MTRHLDGGICDQITQGANLQESDDKQGAELLRHNRHGHKSIGIDGWPQTPVYITLRRQSQRIVWAQMRGVLHDEAVSFGKAQQRPHSRSHAKRRSSSTLCSCVRLWITGHVEEHGCRRCSSSSTQPLGLSWAERTGGGLWVDTHSNFCNTSVPIAPSSLACD